MKAKRSRTIQIKDVLFPYWGLGEDDQGREFCVKHALPGAKLEIVPGRKRGGIREGKIVEILEPSPLETEEGCVHRHICGGCTYQGLSHEAEMTLKKRQIDHLFEREGIKLPQWTMEEAPSWTGYRNKMEYTFGDAYKGGPLVLGLHQKGRYHDILAPDGCRIVHRDMNTLRQGIAAFAQASGLPHYHRQGHTGFYRHAVIRRSHSTGELLLNLVTTTQATLDREGLVKYLLDLPLEGRIAGILHTENDALSDAVIPEAVHRLYGENRLQEHMMGITFHLSAFSFFQTNTEGAEKLYGLVGDLAGQANHDLILDLYSGTGTMAQMMAPHARRVIGVEIVPDAVQNARESAEANGLDNVFFLCGDVKEVVDSLDARAGLAIVDPPREGLHPKAAAWLATSGIPSIIMVSCNPKTLARDLPILMAQGYHIVHFAGLNQFPRTAHVETIALLQKM